MLGNHLLLAIKKVSIVPKRALPFSAAAFNPVDANIPALALTLLLQGDEGEKSSLPKREVGVVG
jgi:hypothetical protein